MRVYKGLIYGSNNQFGTFVLIGCWESNGKRIGCYKNIDSYSYDDPNNHALYSRSKNNVFYLESED